MLPPSVRVGGVRPCAGGEPPGSSLRRLGPPEAPKVAEGVPERAIPGVGTREPRERGGRGLLPGVVAAETPLADLDGAEHADAVSEVERGRRDLGRLLPVRRGDVRARPAGGSILRVAQARARAP